VKDSFKLSEEDRLLVDALQVAPRASWAAISEILGMSAVTAARRWQRLEDAGMAWVTAAPGMAYHNAQCLAYVELTCESGYRIEVAEAVAQHNLALTVELTTSSADLLVTVAAADLSTMSHYLLRHLGQVDHVTGSRARIATRIYAEGSAWRLCALSAPQVAALQRIRIGQSSAAEPVDVSTGMTDSVKAMLTHLSVDGRASYAELAERASVSPATARRYLDRLLRTGAVMSRTDVSAPVSGWPVQVYLWANVPVAELSESALVLSNYRQARLCATVTAGPNLALCAWLQTVEEVHRLELAIAGKLPHLEVVDRLIVLRQVKRLGRLLDEEGSAVGVVPINIWDDLLSHSPDATVAVG
jgi:DNA-binding Lrp family transcriptional regulator